MNLQHEWCLSAGALFFHSHFEVFMARPLRDLLILNAGDPHAAEMAEIAERVNGVSPTWNLLGLPRGRRGAVLWRNAAPAAYMSRPILIWGRGVRCGKTCALAAVVWSA